MKIYLSLFGCYRTFEKSCQYLFENLIDNNPQCSFDIYINTEYIKGYECKKWINKPCSKNFYRYSKEELDILFKKCYKSNLKQITYLTFTPSEI